MGKKSKRVEIGAVDAAAAAPVESDPRLEHAMTQQWLTRFLLGFSGLFLFLAISFAIYNLVLSSRGDDARQYIDKGGVEAYSSAVEILSSPHVFAGYEPYHGFGKESSKKWQAEAEEILAGGADYSAEELGFLIHRVDHYLTAWWLERSANNPPVAGDKVVLLSALDRYTMAIRNAWMFVGYATIVSLLVFLTWFIYRLRWRRLTASAA